MICKAASRALAGAHAALMREVELSLRFAIPGLPAVLAILEDADGAVVVFEHAHGAGLASLVGDDDRLLRAVTSLLKTLGAAHDAGFVHGDLKPEHVIVTERAEVRIVDWGLAAPIGAPARGGSRGFVAPELLDGAPLSPASDLFAAGVTLRAALSGAVPERLASLIDRLIRAAPSERPASAWAAIALLGGHEVPRAVPPSAHAVPPALDAALAEHAIVQVDAPAGAGRSHLARSLVARALERRAPLLALVGCAGFDPLQRLADDLGPSRIDAPEARAARAGTALARMGATIVIDDADRLDEDGIASLRAFARALAAEGGGKLVWIGEDAGRLDTPGARVTLPVLDDAAVRAALARVGARSDEASARALREATGGRAGDVERAVRRLEGRPELTIADAVAELARPTHEDDPPARSAEQTVALAREELARGAPRRAAALLRDAALPGLAAALLRARAEIAAGRLREADAVLAELPASAADDESIEAGLLHAEVCQRLGDHARARAAAARVIARASGDALARGAAIAAQSALTAGDPRAAAELCARGLSAAREPALAARLWALASDAALRGHDPALALAHAERARAEAERADDDAAIAHAWARVASAHGLSGSPAQAREAAAEALRRAERAGDVTALPPFVTNLAAAEHALGEYGAAARGYERAATLAERLGRSGSLAAALTNLAGLLASLQGLDEARALLGRARDAAQGAAAPLFVAQADLIEAETWIATEPARADALAAEAARAFGAIGASRQAREAELLGCEIRLRRGDAAGAEEKASAIAEDARRGGLGPRLDLLLGEARLARGELDDARRAIERALAGARADSDRPLVIRALELAAALHDRLRTGAGPGYRDEARRVAAEVAARIPAGLRERFLAARAEADPRPTPPGSEGRLGEDGRRLLRLAGRALREPDEARVIETALDEAVAITRAEHAFLLLKREDGRPAVAAARNLDKETIKNSRSRFSRGVAERVLRSGEPVVAASAPTDPFLNQQKSVLDLGLLSVLCVPVRAESGVIAALYLDHRFERGRFTDEDREVIQSLADIVGLALEQGRLRREAEARTDELSRAHASLAREAQQKDAELTRLFDALARAPGAAAAGDGDIVGRSLALTTQLDVARRVAKTEIAVLIEGESGTGKELFARRVHDQSLRSAGPFVAINCGALPESLIESELFGHVRGAFTGALRDHPGVFRAAHGGTLFLDEVGELSPRVQTRLLRVLQEREVTALGSARGERVDVRVVAATNRVLDREIAEGRFRADLFFRLAGVRLRLPPLRERPDDLLPLADELLARLAHEPGLRRATLSRSAAQALLAHDWPGNVRELEHALRRAVALSEGPALEAAHFELARAGATASRRDARRKLDREIVLKALSAAKGNRTEAARALGVSRVTVQRLVSGLAEATPGRRGRPKGR